MNERLTWMSWGIVVVAITGCAPAAVSPDTKTPVYVIATPVESDPGLWNVKVDFGGDYPIECNSVGAGAVAKVNDEEIPFAGRGGQYYDYDQWGFREAHCNDLAAAGQVHSSNDGIDRIRITDGSSTVLSADVIRLMVKRTATWVDPPDGAIHAGSDVALQWNPITDHVALVSMADPVPGILVHVDPEATWVQPIGYGAALTWDGSIVHFTAANWYESSGVPSSGTLELNSERVVLPVENVSGDYANVVAEGRWRPQVRYTYAP